MKTALVDSLHREEQTILDHLNASLPFRRLEEIRRLLALYDAPTPVGADLDAVISRSVTPPGGGRDVLRGIGAAMREARSA
ncbi:hypothetical protein [Roseomonas sp. HF4]|uniref:hypothetical protein n=1 Tax=Roseomonas sp. HF4 TaxID=2562313 RepID=UPI0010C01470|nr:hypothetical protein [Roseomonas sp. HF4]